MRRIQEYRCSGIPIRKITWRWKNVFILFYSICKFYSLSATSYCFRDQGLHECDSYIIWKTYFTRCFNKSFLFKVYFFKTLLILDIIRIWKNALLLLCFASLNWVKLSVAFRKLYVNHAFTEFSDITNF